MLSVQSNGQYISKVLETLHKGKNGHNHGKVYNTLNEVGGLVQAACRMKLTNISVLRCFVEATQEGNTACSGIDKGQQTTYKCTHTKAVSCIHNSHSGNINSYTQFGNTQTHSGSACTNVTNSKGRRKHKEYNQ